MAETKLIPTLTEFSVAGTSISITSRYDENDLPDTLLCRIPEEVGNQNGVLFIEGELLIKVKEYLTHIDYQLDGDGNLIQLISTGDEDKYSINENGELIYTTEE
jgi:hypothetical protein